MSRQVLRKLKLCIPHLQSPAPKEDRFGLTGLHSDWRDECKDVL